MAERGDVGDERVGRAALAPEAQRLARMRSTRPNTASPACSRMTSPSTRPSRRMSALSWSSAAGGGPDGGRGAPSGLTSTMPGVSRAVVPIGTHRCQRSRGVHAGRGRSCRRMAARRSSVVP